MLHGDGQYPATAVPALIEALGRPGVGMAYGTRFGAAGADQTPPLRRGGVWALSALQNLVSGLRLAEWCSGFRAFRCEALARVPFAACDDDYFFDLQIILLLHLAGWRIAELPVPKQYDGAPPSGLKLARFGRRVLAHALHYPLARHGLVRDPLYDPRQWDRLGRAPVPAPVPVSVGRAA
jgi:hypothetical protein